MHGFHTASWRMFGMLLVEGDTNLTTLPITACMHMQHGVQPSTTIAGVLRTSRGRSSDTRPFIRSSKKKQKKTALSPYLHRQIVSLCRNAFYTPPGRRYVRTYVRKHARVWGENTWEQCTVFLIAVYKGFEMGKTKNGNPGENTNGWECYYYGGPY